MSVLGTVDLGNGSQALTVDHDPTSTATDAPIGSLVINVSTAIWYRKLDNGSTTNFKITSISAGSVVSGDIGVGVVVSGNIGSGAVVGRAGGGFTIASGSIGSMDLASGAITSGSIASGSIGPFSLASGAVTSGHIGNAAVVSGSIASGTVGTPHHASGSIISQARSVIDDFSAGGSPLLTEETVSGLVAVTISQSGRLRIAMASVSGRMPAVGLTVSGALSGLAASFWTDGFFQTSSGLFDVSGYLGGQVVVGRSGQVGVVSGSYLSGGFLSGDIIQQLGIAANSGAVRVKVDPFTKGGVQTIPASFWIGSGDLASGQVGNTHLSSGAVLSGHVASGQIGQFHVSSGAISSGRLGVVGTPDGTQFLRDDFTWGDVTVSGSIQSGHVASGAVQGFFGPTRNIASGTVGVFDLGSGAVVAGTVGSGAIVSGNIASGQVGNAHLGSGAVLSGHVASGQVGSFHLADEAVTSGDIASGSISTFKIASGGLLSGAIGSGQIGPTHLGSGSVLSGHVASGQVGQFHVASGSITSGRIGAAGTPDGTRFLRDDFTWATAGGGLVSGAVESGYIASGAVQGFFGATRHIASGTVGVFDLGSGAVIAGTVGSGAVVSGNIASGQVGDFHIASGAVTSGRLGVAGTPDGTRFLRDDFTWQTAGGGLTSGAVQSGHIASGAVQGFFGATRNVASGTIGVFDLGSGAVIAGTIGSGAVSSGNIASGQVGGLHFASGSVITAARQVIDDFSLAGTPLLTEETVSGFVAVHITQSGNLRIAMPAVSGRMPAAGIAVSGVLSGLACSFWTDGFVQASSGMLDFSGFVGQPIFVARSGQLGPISGGYLSGGFQSGDLQQRGGIAVNSGTLRISIDSSVKGATQSVPATSWVFSGDIASGQIGDAHLGSGAVLSGHVASGQIGQFHVASGSITSGRLGVTETPDGTKFLRDDFTWQTAGASLTSGAIQSGHIASGAIQGFFGATRHIASGTVGVFDLGSGAVAAGTIGSGAVQSGNIASGQIGDMHLASGAVTSGHVASGSVQGFFGGTRNIASGTIGGFDLGSGAVLSGNVGSGQIGVWHINSGETTSIAQYLTSNSAPTAQALTATYTVGGPESGLKAVTVLSGGLLGQGDARSGFRLPAIGVTDFGVSGTASGTAALVYLWGTMALRSGLEQDFISTISGQRGPIWLASGAAPVGRMTAALPASGAPQQRMATVVTAGVGGGTLVVMPGDAFQSGAPINPVR